MERIRLISITTKYLGPPYPSTSNSTELEPNGGIIFRAISQIWGPCFHVTESFATRTNLRLSMIRLFAKIAESLIFLLVSLVTPQSSADDKKYVYDYGSL